MGFFNTIFGRKKRTDINFFNFVYNFAIKAEFVSFFALAIGVDMYQEGKG